MCVEKVENVAMGYMVAGEADSCHGFRCTGALSVNRALWGTGMLRGLYAAGCLHRP